MVKRIKVTRENHEEVEKFLDKLGYHWCDGDSLLDYTPFRTKGEDKDSLVYVLEDMTVTYDPIVDESQDIMSFDFYKGSASKGYKLQRNELQAIASYWANEATVIDCFMSDNYELISRYPNMEKAISDQISECEEKADYWTMEMVNDNEKN